MDPGRLHGPITGIRRRTISRQGNVHLRPGVHECSSRVRHEACRPLRSIVPDARRLRAASGKAAATDLGACSAHACPIVGARIGRVAANADRKAETSAATSGGDCAVAPDVQLQTPSFAKCIEPGGAVPGADPDDAWCFVDTVVPPTVAEHSSATRNMSRSLLACVR